MPRVLIQNADPRSAPPQLARDGERPSLNARDLCVGCIAWLPGRDLQQTGIKCDKEDCCGNRELDDGGYNHPVIVLSLKQRHGSTMVTTYSDTSLESYLKKRTHSSHYQKSLPIFDSEAKDMASFGTPCPAILHLEGGRKLHKQSYVRLQHTYEVPRSLLRQYNYRARQAYKKRLTEESYNILMKELGMVPETYQETRRLSMAAEPRLTAPAGSTGGLSYVFPTTRPLSTTPIYSSSNRASQASVHTTPQVPRNYGTAPYTVPTSQVPCNYGTAPYTAPTSHVSRNYGTTHTYHSARPLPRHDSTTYSDSYRWSDRYDRSPEPREYVGLFVFCVLAFVAVGAFLWWNLGLER